MVDHILLCFSFSEWILELIVTIWPNLVVVSSVAFTPHTLRFCQRRDLKWLNFWFLHRTRKHAVWKISFARQKQTSGVGWRVKSSGGKGIHFGLFLGGVDGRKLHLRTRELLFRVFGLLMHVFLTFEIITIFEWQHCSINYHFNRMRSGMFRSLCPFEWPLWGRSTVSSNNHWVIDWTCSSSSNRIRWFQQTVSNRTHLPHRGNCVCRFSSVIRFTFSWSIHFELC